MTAKYAEAMRRNAVMQGKEALLVIEFPDNLVVEATIRKI